MTNNYFPQTHISRRLLRRVNLALLAIACLLAVNISHAQLTDIANAPLTNGGAIAVKPNIMLLLDNSNSMKRTHMPDGLETVLGNNVEVLPLGYKAYQCNVLYYNPNQVYLLPRNADGTQFPTPSFTAARYDGFDSGSALVNLSSGFQAHDTNTRRWSSPFNVDPPKAAYYYTHTSNQSFDPVSAPCTDMESGTYPQTATVSPTGVTGQWNRITVAAGDAQATNFAVWYSYYRTRLNLAKSAISLAFTPLTDSYRVGFLAVLSSATVSGGGAVQPAYYEPIKDFNPTNRAAWFSKLFSQVARSTSPAREALARVGRHYAGQTDGINAGMPEDPIQYSCQQNFVIATTDGYWNSNADEEPVGPVKIDGTTLVGQQDGTLTTNAGNTPRPIWDGMSDNTRVVTDKNNLYSYAPCTSNWYNLETSRLEASTSRTTRSTLQTRQSTVQNRQTAVQNFYTDTVNLRSTVQITQSTSQPLESSTQVLRATLQNRASTQQNSRSTVQNQVNTQQIRYTSTQTLRSTSQPVSRQTVRYVRVDRIQETSSQVLRSTLQNLQSTSSPRRTSVQRLESRTQNFRTDSQITRTMAQITQSTAQVLQSTNQPRATQVQNLASTFQTRVATSRTDATTTQLNRSTTQNTSTQTQVRRSTSQMNRCQSEVCVAVQTCTPSAGVTCEPTVVSGLLVASCTPATASSANEWTTTTCAVSTVGPSPVQTCTPVAPVAGNNFTQTTCNVVTTGPTPIGSCTNTAAASGNSWTTTTCSTATTGPTAVQTCTAAAAASGNNWTQTTCTPVTTGPTAVSSCTPSTASSGNSWTTTTCPNLSTGPTPVSSCTNTAADSGNSWTSTTCTNNNFTNQPVSSCTPQSGNAGNSWITISCPPAVTTTNVAVQTCTASGGTSGNSWVTTTCTPNNTGPTGVSSCSPITATGPNWITTSCGNGNSGPTGVSSCTPQTGNSGNNWITITCGNNNSGPTAVSSCTPQTGNGANLWLTRTCTNANTSNVPVATCTPQTGNSGNSWLTITCANTGPDNYSNQPAQSCTPSSATAPNWITITCPAPVTTTNVPIPGTCVPSAGVSPNWVTTTCPAAVTTANVPAPSCTVGPGTSPNWINTTACTLPPATNYADTPVASCTAQAAAVGNSWRTISCANANVSGPTVVNPASCAVGTTFSGSPAFETTQCYDGVNDIPSQSCTPSAATAPNWITTTCPGSVVTGPTPVQAGTGSCPGGQVAAAVNNWTTITCNLAGPNVFTNDPRASCTPQTANAGNNWITVTCPTPITTTSFAATCTPVEATAANNPTTGTPWTSTTCSVNTSGPTVVDPATCPVSGSFGGARTAITTAGTSPNFITVTCTPIDATNVPVATCTVGGPTPANGWTNTSSCSPVTTGPTAVATCTNRTAVSGNNPDTGTPWTSTTCTNPPATNYTNTPVSSCTPSGGTSPNWITRTCSSAVTGPTGVPSCTPANPTALNNWTTTTCNFANNFPNVPIPTACVPSSPTAVNGWVTTTCPAPTVTDPTPIATCTPSAGTSPTWVVRTCSNPGPNNYVAQPVATCTPQTAAAANNFVTITCPAAITTGPTGVASCVASSASVGNNWVTTSCTPNNTGPTAVAPATCVATSPNAGNGYTETICDLLTTGPTPVASCTPASATSPNFVTTTCNAVTTGPILTQTCTPAAAAAGNNFTATNCPLAPGQRIQYATSTTVTTALFSGGIAIGSPVVTSSTGAVADLDSVCYIAGVNSLPPFPNPGKPGTTWVNGIGNNVTIPPATTLPCTEWPCTTNSDANAGGSSNSLADVAQYYYVTDLRPTMEDNVPNNGTGPEDDRVTHQHMTTFTIGLGVSGDLQYRPDYRSGSTTTGAFAEIRTGPRNWTIPAADQPGSIDDFWHAAVNGRGQYFSAGNPTTVVNGLASALAGVTARTGSGSAAAPSSQEPSLGANLTYIAGYVTQKWSGEVEAREIDLATGGPKTTVVWSAKAKLDAKAGNACDNRVIHLFRSGATNNMVPLTWNTRACDTGGSPTGVASTGMNAAERANFGAANVALLSQYPSMTDGTSGTVDQRTPAAGDNLLNYVRGQRGLEDFQSNVADKLFRRRDTILGDIVNSSPRYVKKATADYQENNYDVFAATSESRIPMVYVASNGGMLHAFRAGTSTTDTTGGNEEWSFVPTQVLPNLYKLADNNYASNHQYSVDGTPVPSDVYDTTAAAWKKVLVAGLNAGGKGYYALDVTNPLAPKALWEFNWSNTCYDGTVANSGADCHLGFSFGKPIFGKLSNGTWVVMVTSGHNNVNAPAKVGDGQGYLYVLNAITGKIIYKISTGAGTATAPSGLGQIALYADDPTVSLLALQVYGADLMGNVWRFDINDRILPAGRDAALVGIAKAPDGTRQPITTTMKLLEVDGKAMIVFGTGRLLGTSDLSDNQVQSIYAFIDDLTTSYSSLRSSLAPLTMTQSGADNSAAGYRTIACSGTTAQCGSTVGWYTDLPSSGERLVVDLRVELGTLEAATSIMSASACTVGGIGKRINLNVLTGLALPGTSGQVSRGYLPSLPVGISVLKLPDGSIVSVIADSAGANTSFPFPYITPAPQGKRVTWRELIQ